MIFKETKFAIREKLVLFTGILFITAMGHAQIGTAVKEDKVIVGSSGGRTLELPFLERTKVSGKLPYYTLWYWDDSYSDRQVKSFEFFASELELDYLYKVLKEGFEVGMQRLEIGECRIVTHRPLREGGPLKVTVYYEDDSYGIFYLKDAALERMLGKYRNSGDTYIAGHTGGQ